MDRSLHIAITFLCLRNGITVSLLFFEAHWAKSNENLSLRKDNDTSPNDP